MAVGEHVEMGTAVAWTLRATSPLLVPCISSIWLFLMKPRSLTEFSPSNTLLPVLCPLTSILCSRNTNQQGQTAKIAAVDNIVNRLKPLS